MSSHLTAEVVRGRQLEIAASTAHAQHLHELRIADGRSGRTRSSRTRRRVAIAAGLCFALAGTGAATASASSNREAGNARSNQHLSAGQLQSRIRALEAMGYEQVSCRVGSTEMYSAKANRYVTVSWTK